MKRIIIFGCLGAWMLGCVWSVETNEKFESFRNKRVGEPAYSSHIQAGVYGVLMKKSGKISKYIVDHRDGCKYMWVIDTSQKGRHTNKHGYTSEIEGIVTDWKYLSSKENCKDGYTPYLQ